MVALIDTLKESIDNGDAPATLETLETIDKELPGNQELMAELLRPQTLTGIHQAMVEKLKVNQRHLKIRRVPLPKTRAMLFVKAMINGVKNCESMVS